MARVLVSGEHADARQSDDGCHTMAATTASPLEHRYRAAIQFGGYTGSAILGTHGLRHIGVKAAADESPPN